MNPIANLKEVFEITKEATRIERERCSRLVDAFFDGKIDTRIELKEKIENGDDA